MRGACGILVVLGWLCGCGASRPSPSAAGPVIIVGLAVDAKGGAIVATDDGAAIYVAGLDRWPAELAGQRVEVSGRRARRKLLPDPEVSPSGAWSAGAEGEQDVIDGATWRLAVP
jgi:hypothetical protein